MFGPQEDGGEGIFAAKDLLHFVALVLVQFQDLMLRHPSAQTGLKSLNKLKNISKQ